MNRECSVNNCYLIVNTHSSMRKVNLNDILCFIVQGEYVNIQLVSQHCILTMDSLIKLEEVLPHSFFRVNRSVIINMDYCESFQLAYRYSFVKMSGGMQFTVSRRRYVAFREACNTILVNNTPERGYFHPLADFQNNESDNNKK